MKLRIVIFVVIYQFLSGTLLYSKEDIWRGRNIANLFSVGKVSLYEEYLSVLPYDGMVLGWTRDRIALSRRFTPISYQSLLQVNLANTTDFSKNGNLWYGMLRYHWGSHYKWNPLNRLNLYAGMLVGGHVGALYNIRNSNNPAQAKFNMGLSLSGSFSYKFTIRQSDFYLRGQSFWKTIGVTFSPHFGQSYYEIFSLGNRNNLFLFSSFHNTLEINNLITIDYPLSWCTLRIGYANYFLKSYLNQLQTHLNQHAFLIGFTKEGLRFNNKSKRKPIHYQSPIYE